MVKWFAGARHKLAKKFALADKLTALLAVLVVAGSLIAVSPAVTTAFAAGEVDSNLGGVEVSISRFSEVLADGFNDVMSAALSNNVNKDYMTKLDGKLKLATIGNILGYASGMDRAENAGNVWTSGTDAASRVMSLETVMSFYSDAGGKAAADDVKTSLISQYVVFGSTLNYLGVDEFRDAQSNQDGFRTITGYATYVVFILAYSAHTIMNAVLKLMDKFNVFRLFWGWGGQVLTDLIGTDDAFYQQLQGMYEVIKDIRWVVMGLLVIAYVVSITVWKSRAMGQAGDAQQRFRNLLYRLVVMAIGVPLCGMIYTEALDIVKTGGLSVASTKYVLTDYIFQEFMDFESWTTDAKDGGAVFELNSDSYSGISVKYETNLNAYTVKLLKGGAEEDVDVSKLVFLVNRTVYGQDVVGPDMDKVAFANAIYKGSLSGDDEAIAGNFSNLLHLSANATPSDDDQKAYDTARKLILSYARSDLVSADTLNDFYVQDRTEFSSLLFPMDGTSENSTKNMGVVEQIFGTQAAEQRIWSYIGDMGTNWIYPNDASGNEIPMAGNDVTVKITGYPFISGSNTSGAGGVNVTGPGGSATIMKRTLNVYDRATNQLWSSAVLTVENPLFSVDAATNGRVYEYKYNLRYGGMSAMALYNYMHTKFENGQITVYSPANTTNAGVGMMHYAVTTPYSGIPEIVQLLYVISILFCIGIIGWVFGISLLMSTMIQAIKAIPIIFKMIVGSVQGFVEGLLIALSICVEMLVTIFLYTQSINIINFLIKIVKNVVSAILKAFQIGGTAAAGGAVNVDPESYGIMSGIISIFMIVWGTLELIKWRQAITISIKSIITHMMNTVFGTSAEMPTGASNGMLKGAAALAAGGMAMGALAQDGALDDVVNDLTDSDLGTSIHDKITEGDWEGAMQDIQDYAGGTYRGRSDTADAENALGDGDIGSANGWQSLTDQDEKELSETYDDDIKQADEELQTAEEALANGTGSQEDVDKARQKRDDLISARSSDAASRRHANYEKANELGVADYGDYLREQAEQAEDEGVQPVEGADLPEEPSKQLDRDGHMAYDAAKDGDARTLRSASQIYDGNGLKAHQREAINEMIKDGASETEIAAAIDNFKQENFGDDADAVVDKINEAAGRSGEETYGSTDNSDGKARTVTVSSSQNEETGGIDYAVTDSNAEDGEQIISAVDEDGQSTYTNTTRKEGGFFGIGAKGETHTTADFGAQATADAGAMTYGDIHNNMDAVANMTGGMISKGTGDGKQGWLKPDQTTVTEAASQYAADQAAVITGGPATSSFTNRGVANQTAAALQTAGVTNLSQATSMESSGVVIESAPGAAPAPAAGGPGNLNGFVEQSTGVVQTQSRVAPPSADGIIYVQNQSGGYTVATGAEPSGTQHFVMQYDDAGQQTYAKTFAGTKYVQNPNGKGYIPQGVAPQNYTPSSIPFEKLNEFISGGGQLDENGAPIFDDGGSQNGGGGQNGGTDPDTWTDPGTGDDPNGSLI